MLEYLFSTNHTTLFLWVTGREMGGGGKKKGEAFKNLDHLLSMRSFELTSYPMVQAKRYHMHGYL